MLFTFWKRCLQFLIVCFWLLGACAPTPFYAGSRLETTLVGEIERSDLVIALDDAIQGGRVPRFEMTTSEGRYVIHPPEPNAPAIDALPLPVLVATYNVLYHKDMLGIEWDLLVKTEHGQRVPVTAYLAPNGHLHVVQGQPLPPPAPAAPLPPDELRRRYGIGELKDGDTQWTEEERRVLDSALALVPPEERAFLSGMPFVRYHEPPGDGESKKETWTTNAIYYKEQGQAEIQLFDHLFGLDATRFCGDIGDPHPASAQIIVHEIGHALVSAAQVKAAHIYFTTLARLNLALYKLRLLPRNSMETMPLVEQLEKDVATLNAIKPKLKRLLETSAVLTAFKEVRGFGKGPTRYGRTSLKESFAESYSLFRVDPAALRRVYPAVYEWFLAGGHLRAMRSEE